MSSGDRQPVDVSVVIAAYNAARTIREAVLSALQQERVSLEVLVCDDASTDDTVEQLASIRDSRLRVFRKDQNAGAGAARDFLVDQARGEFIAFLDSDDCYLPGRLARLVEVARRFPGSLVFDDILECHDTAAGLVPFRRVHGRAAFHGGLRRGEPRPVTLARLVSATRLLVKPCIPRARLLQAGVRHSPHRYGEDGLFLWRMIARGIPAIYVPEPLYLYRVTPGSLSANPLRYTLVADCLAELARENLADEDRRAVLSRESEFRDVAVFRSIPGGFSAAKLVAAVRYFTAAPARIPRWLVSWLQQRQYHLSRRLAGAPRR